MGVGVAVWTQAARAEEDRGARPESVALLVCGGDD